MKIIIQIAIIFSICWVSQMIEALLPIAFPASVIAMVLLLLLLRRVTARRDGKPPVPPHTELHREGGALRNEEDPPKT